MISCIIKGSPQTSYGSMDTNKLYLGQTFKTKSQVLFKGYQIYPNHTHPFIRQVDIMIKPVQVAPPPLIDPSLLYSPFFNVHPFSLAGFPKIYGKCHATVSRRQVYHVVLDLKVTGRGEISGVFPRPMDLLSTTGEMCLWMILWSCFQIVA